MGLIKPCSVTQHPWGGRQFMALCTARGRPSVMWSHASPVTCFFVATICCNQDRFTRLVVPYFTKDHFIRLAVLYFTKDYFTKLAVLYFTKDHFFRLAVLYFTKGQFFMLAVLYFTKDYFTWPAVLYSTKGHFFRLCPFFPQRTASPSWLSGCPLLHCGLFSQADSFISPGWLSFTLTGGLFHQAGGPFCHQRPFYQTGFPTLHWEPSPCQLSFLSLTTVSPRCCPLLVISPRTLTQSWLSFILMRTLSGLV